MRSILKIEGKEIDAMLYTGSSMNLIKASTYIKIGTPSLRREITNLSGLGDEENTLGCFITKVEIEGECFETTIHVVPDGTITSETLIGNSLLNEAELTIRRGR